MKKANKHKENTLKICYKKQVTVNLEKPLKFDPCVQGQRLFLTKTPNFMR